MKVHYPHWSRQYAERANRIARNRAWMTGEPKAAAAYFPYMNHRTVAQVDEDGGQ